MLLLHEGSPEHIINMTHMPFLHHWIWILLPSYINSDYDFYLQLSKNLKVLAI